MVFFINTPSRLADMPKKRMLYAMMQKYVHAFFALPPRTVVALYALGSAVLVLMAFVLEHGFGALPCQMCWWQRYGHWAMAAVAGTSAALPRLLPPVWGLAATLLAALYGLGVAVYQILVQLKLVPLPQGCGSTGLKIEASVEDFLKALQNPVVAPSCDRVDFHILGLSLADWNALTMAAAIAVGVVFLRRWMR